MPPNKTIEKAKPLATASAKKEETILPTVRTAAHPSNSRARTLCVQTSQASRSRAAPLARASRAQDAEAARERKIVLKKGCSSEHDAWVEDAIDNYGFFLDPKGSGATHGNRSPAGTNLCYPGLFDSAHLKRNLIYVCRNGTVKV